MIINLASKEYSKAIEKPEDIQKFERLGYVFHPEFSSEKEYVFLKENSV